MPLALGPKEWQRTWKVNYNVFLIAILLLDCLSFRFACRSSCLLGKIFLLYLNFKFPNIKFITILLMNKWASFTSEPKNVLLGPLTLYTLRCSLKHSTYLISICILFHEAFKMVQLFEINVMNYKECGLSSNLKRAAYFPLIWSTIFL